MKFENGKTNYEEYRAAIDDNKKTIYRKQILAYYDGKTELALDLSDEITLLENLNITTLNGKLDGFYSISTSVLMNPVCQARAKDPDTICARCYAAVSVSNYHGLMQGLEYNYIVLNTWLFSKSAWKTVAFPTTNGYGRIESHGDVASVTQARNYIRLIKTHTHIHFGVWSKNVNYWIQAFKIEGKPENMNFIVSSPYMNRVETYTENEYKYIDHVFTVYDKKTIAEKSIDINCGARDCNSCRRCYDHKNDFSVFHIREQLK